MPDLRPDSGFSPFDQFDPDELARTERFVDALAMRLPVEFGDDRDRAERDEQSDRALAGLLEDWRDELRSPSAPLSELEVCSELQAVAALNRGLAARRGIRRGLALVGSMAATVLGIGGFGVMVGDAQPGEALYGVHTMLFGELPSVHDDRIALSAKTDLDLVQQMITQGQWDQAHDKLAAVSDSVQTVNDYDRKQTLIDQVKSMNAKVVNRDPNATVLPNPDVSPLTGMTPASGTTASATSSDASATAVSSPLTTDLTASLSMTSQSMTSQLASSTVPAVSLTATPTAVPSTDSSNPTQPPGSALGPPGSATGQPGLAERQPVPAGG